MDGWKDTFLQCSSLMGSFQDIYWQTSNGIYNGSLEIGIDINQWDMGFFYQWMEVSGSSNRQGRTRCFDCLSDDELGDSLNYKWWMGWMGAKSMIGSNHIDKILIVLRGMGDGLDKIYLYSEVVMNIVLNIIE